jgi:hypothetical protein
VQPKLKTKYAEIGALIFRVRLSQQSAIARNENIDGAPDWEMKTSTEHPTGVFARSAMVL